MSALHCPAETHEGIEGIQVVGIRMVRERILSYNPTPIRTPENAARILAAFLNGLDRECFVVLCLDTKNMVNAINLVSMGTLSATLVHPREVFKPAVLSNAAGIIVAHNHPSGNLEPSTEDKAVAKTLAEAGKILGIGLLDSLILGENGRFFSFKDNGLL